MPVCQTKSLPSEKGKWTPRMGRYHFQGTSSGLTAPYGQPGPGGAAVGITGYVSLRRANGPLIGERFIFEAGQTAGSKLMWVEAKYSTDTSGSLDFGICPSKHLSRDQSYRFPICLSISLSLPDFLLPLLPTVPSPLTSSLGLSHLLRTCCVSRTVSDN